MNRFITYIVVLITCLTGSSALLAAEPSKYELALPGYKFQFPRDHYSHDKYKTEWWYYTGHLKSDDGKLYGFELTFFRSAMPVDDGVEEGPWSLKSMYMAHFALSDINGGKFYHKEKLSRAGVGNAGASENDYNVWIENWSASGKDGKFHLRAKDADFAIDLNLDQGKNLVLHGENGVSQKAACVGCASHYYSMTRMPLTGTVLVAGKESKVSGIAWMDHEFGSNQLAEDQVGWDWYAIQLDDKTEMMLYLMRLKNGQYDPHSSGTIIGADGKFQHLPLSGYSVETIDKWTSPHTGGKYPSKWHVTLPSQKIDLTITPQLADQELTANGAGVNYWEGACSVSGRKDGKAVEGQAYVELTGYDKALGKKL